MLSLILLPAMDRHGLQQEQANFVKCFTVLGPPTGFELMVMVLCFVAAGFCSSSRQVCSRRS
jgi:hypothetical protein